MQLIPVIDLKNGVVVHAKQGQREHYAPINSLLCSSCKPSAVIAAFLQLFPFKIIYLADLNAITGQGTNQALIVKILQTHADICFWIDAGSQSPQWVFKACDNYALVLGSESYDDKQFARLCNLQQKLIVSLDFSIQGEALGSPRFFNEPELLSNKIIMMTLARVGSKLGPDFNKLRYYQKVFPQVEIIASGGIRGTDDLKRLKAQGINKALCATALHNKTINRLDIENLASHTL